MTICYGMTETSPVSTQTSPDDPFEAKVGTPRPGGAAPRGQGDRPGHRSHPAARGGRGELCTQGYSVMLGYWDDEERTREVLVDGWMHTGDLAVMDEAGYLQITGRIKDVVIRGGENIYPREIEEFLYTHPDIVDAQVIGVPDERYGEELMAWIRLREGAEPIDAAALRSFCSGRRAHFKIPRYVHLVDEFPMTVTGKVRKVEMREASAVLLGRSRARQASRSPRRADAGTGRTDKYQRERVWTSPTWVGVGLPSEVREPSPGGPAALQPRSTALRGPVHRRHLSWRSFSGSSQSSWSSSASSGWSAATS